MDWTKVKTKHFLFSTMTDREQAGLVRLLCLTAHLEKMPSEIEMGQVCGQKTLKSLSNRFQSEGKSLSNVLQKVLEDVSKIEDQRSKNTQRQREFREKHKNSNALHNRYITPQIREDKIREDKNIKELFFFFEEIFNKYPNRIGKKESMRHLKSSVKTEKDRKEIQDALENYKKHLEVNTWKGPMNAKTWFNNWRDWVDWQEPERKEGDGERDKRLLAEIRNAGRS